MKLENTVNSYKKYIASIFASVVFGLVSGCVTTPTFNPDSPLAADEVDIYKSVGVFKFKNGDYEILRSVKVAKGLKKSIVNKRIYLEFIGSPTMSKSIRDRLSERGYVFSETKEGAEASIILIGGYGLHLAGKRPVYNELGPIIEKQAKYSNAMHASDEKVETIALHQVMVNTVIFRQFDWVNFAAWVGQQSGFTEMGNKSLLGTPDGYCNGSRCETYQNTIRIKVLSDLGSWTLDESAVANRNVLDTIIPDAIDKALSPLMTLGHVAVSNGESAKQ